MHPKIIEFIRYAKQKGIGPIQIASNALLLDEGMQEALIDAEIDFISFSLDTVDEAVYQCSRLTGDLKVSSRNVENFGRKCAERRKRGLTAPIIQVSTIDIQEYKVSQKEFIDKWLQYADIVRVYEQHDENGRFVNEETRRRMDLFEQRMPCRKILTDMIIYWDGRLALCNYDWDEKRDIGNVSDLSLQEAWDSAAYEQIRQMHIRNDIDESICRECEHWKIDYVDNGFLGRAYKAEGK